MHMRIPGKESTHLVIRDGAFHALVVQLTDGNYIVLRPGDKVYTSVTEAMEAVLGPDRGGVNNSETYDGIAPADDKGEWFPGE